MKTSSPRYSKNRNPFSPSTPQKYESRIHKLKKQRMTPIHLIENIKTPSSKGSCDGIRKGKFNASPIKIDFKRAICENVEMFFDILSNIVDPHELDPDCGNCDADGM